jgi:hypothetical protein
MGGYHAAGLAVLESEARPVYTLSFNLADSAAVVPIAAVGTKRMTAWKDPRL